MDRESFTLSYAYSCKLLSPALTVNVEEDEKVLKIKVWKKVKVFFVYFRGTMAISTPI